MLKRIILAMLIGVTVTLLLIALSFAADDAGYEILSNMLFWQNWVLQALVPTPSMESLQHPFTHGLPLAFVAWFASVPLGFAIYGVAAFALMRRLRPVAPKTPE